eukprot:GHRQ01037937.1.p2 GENE.GHRQ01037937.1~~GHRQ01037937.1.p2  ORF type:complete len:126 (-),score=11.49 GHRQ01037937.1:123-500(-)
MQCSAMQCTRAVGQCCLCDVRVETAPATKWRAREQPDQLVTCHPAEPHLLATITALPRTARPFLRVLGLYMPMMSRSTDSLDANASTDLRALPCCRAGNRQPTASHNRIGHYGCSLGVKVGILDL